jgi:hypothetical protein
MSYSYQKIWKRIFNNEENERLGNRHWSSHLLTVKGDNHDAWWEIGNEEMSKMAWNLLLKRFHRTLVGPRKVRTKTTWTTAQQQEECTVDTQYNKRLSDILPTGQVGNLSFERNA